MSDAILPGDPPIDIVMRRSAQARRISLRVSGLDGRVTLTLPRRGSPAEALGFARQKESWIREQLARQTADVPVGPGTVIPVLGREMTVTRAEGVRGRIDGDRILVGGRTATGPAVERLLRLVARRALGEASDRHAAALGRGYSRLTLRDPRSRWGSCSSSGNLMFSWRLVLAPPGVLDYVAAHEVAHLERMDHSPAFWAVVADLTPDYAAPRAWLRREGAGLHCWKFDR